MLIRDHFPDVMKMMYGHKKSPNSYWALSVARGIDYDGKF